MVSTVLGIDYSECTLEVNDISSGEDLTSMGFLKQKCCLHCYISDIHV